LADAFGPNEIGIAAALLAPSAKDETSIAGTFLVLAMVALYFGLGGLSPTLRTIYESYAIWPAARFLPLFTGRCRGRDRPITRLGDTL
jgi:type III secretory pathway component EscT